VIHGRVDVKSNRQYFLGFERVQPDESKDFPGPDPKLIVEWPIAPKLLAIDYQNQSALD